MRKEYKDVNIALLKTPERNTRIHPEKQINEIRRSLKKWGQFKNAIIDDQYLVLAGNGMVEAMKLEGYKKVRVIIFYDMPEKDKEKLMLADNKTAGLGVDNLDNIQAIINDLDGDFDIPGFDDDVLASINAASEEISRALEDYGKATEDNLAGIEARAEVNSEEGNGEDESAAAKTPAEGRNYIRCPKCGEEIWL